MIGTARASGAITILNAIANGKGATVAVDLPTEATVHITEAKGRWSARVNGKPTTSPLAELAAKDAIRAIGRDPNAYSGSVETRTSVPVGVGLKTSSSSSVAIALATCAAFGDESLSSDEVLRCSVTSSLASKASVTGALDDASSCLLGGTNFADNRSGKILSSKRVGTGHPVLLRVPHTESRRDSVSGPYAEQFSGLADWLFAIGMKGQLWKAMTLNGILYSTLYGYSHSPAIVALQSGALGAGLSGTGPATAAVFDDPRAVAEVAALWAGDGSQVITTRTTDQGGRVDA